MVVWIGHGMSLFADYLGAAPALLQWPHRANRGLFHSLAGQFDRNCRRQPGVVQHKGDVCGQRAALGQLEDPLQQERGDGLGGDALCRGLGQCGLDMRG